MGPSGVAMMILCLLYVDKSISLRLGKANVQSFVDARYVRLNDDGVSNVTSCPKAFKA